MDVQSILVVAGALVAGIFALLLLNAVERSEGHVGCGDLAAGIVVFLVVIALLLLKL